MKVDCRKLIKGIDIKLLGKDYRIIYPKGVWDDYPAGLKDVLADNLVYLLTMHLPLILNEEEVDYNTSSPYFKSLFYENMINDIIASSDTVSQSSANLLRKFINIDYRFRDYNVKLPDYRQDVKERSVITFTFGKESLLTYALCNEINMDSLLVYIKEPELADVYENEHKRTLIRDFKKKFNANVLNLFNGPGIMRQNKYWGFDESSLAGCLQLTSYCLELLPFSNYLNAGYLMFGNEKSCNDFYYNNNGFRSYPIFDQTHEWMIQLDNVTRLMTDNALRTVSIVEPLHEIAITKILHNRYREIGRYQMSCFTDNSNGKNNRWCQSCSKCMRMFIFMKAVGVDVSNVGFTKNLLDKEFMKLYPLFANGNSDIKMIRYDHTGNGKDEQMLAFYMAYKNGVKGDLIDEFKKKFLEEAKSREDELYKKFFSVHDSITIPKGIKKNILSIYKEELREYN